MVPSTLPNNSHFYAIFWMKEIRKRPYGHLHSQSPEIALIRQRIMKVRHTPYRPSAYWN
jgi:hypothetical protein